MFICNKLKISQRRFKKLFPSADTVIFFRDPRNDEEFEKRYLTNKLWRLCNLYTIVNKDGVMVSFNPNESQFVVYSESLKHPRLIILKSRQQGISTFWLISFLDDAIFLRTTSIGLMAQGKDEATTLLTRAKLGWDNLKGSIKSYKEAHLDTDNVSELGFSNKSVIFIRTSFRSTTLQRLHISEYGKICNEFPERASEVKTGTLQAIAPGNTVVIESTGEGDNDFKHMWEKDFHKCVTTLGPKEFNCVFLSWLQDPDCNFYVDRVPTPEQAKYFKKITELTGITLTKTQKNFWIDQEDELGAKVYQEYPTTPEEAFKATRKGTYYADLVTEKIVNTGRVVPNLYDPNLPVDVIMDIGMDDYFVLGFVQVWRGEYRLVHEYVNNGVGLSHYVDYINATDYDIATVYGPHDMTVRELNHGMSREDRMIELGVDNLELLPKLGVSDGIELVRKLIPNLYLDVTCSYVLKCMLNYSKEWDSRRMIWRDKPMKSVHNHGADMIRYLAVSRLDNSEEGSNSIYPGRSASRSSQVVDGMAF